MKCLHVMPAKYGFYSKRNDINVQFGVINSFTTAVGKYNAVEVIWHSTKLDVDSIPFKFLDKWRLHSHCWTRYKFYLSFYRKLVDSTHRILNPTELSN